MSRSRKYDARPEWFPNGEAGAADLFRRVVPLVRRALKREKDPYVTELAKKKRSPFKVLVSTVISARTKDEVTADASTRLFSAADNPKAMLKLSEKRISELIYPAGFYRTKARAIRALSGMIIERFGGRVPDTIEELVELPGVGRKTANLVLILGFGKPAMCVDTHVHRVSNRLGAIETDDARMTEFALRKVLPRRYWLQINDLFVVFGQKICRPVSPLCSTCIVRSHCARIGVRRSR